MDLKLGMSDELSLNNMLMLLSGGTTLDQIVSAWQNARTNLVHAAGTVESLWGADSSWNLDVTFIDPGYAFRQDGLLKQITAWITPNPTEVSTIKFKIFRLSSGTTYDFVTEQSFSVATSAAVPTKYTFTLSPPIAVQMGDVPGVRTYHNPAWALLNAKSLPAWTPNLRYVSGDVTTQTNFTSTNAAHVGMEFFMLQPYIAVTGDSIAEGRGNGATHWFNGLDNGSNGVLPGGEPTSEVANQLRGKIGDGATVEYQNLALGSQTFAYVAATGIVNCVAVKPNTIIIHCGINDILTDRAWANVETDLNTIKAAITTQKLLIDEILPCSNASDVRAANIRTFNAALAVWCAANGATLVPCWSDFGQLRASTGFNDDLLAAYSQDGTHLSTAGTDALAVKWMSKL